MTDPKPPGDEHPNADYVDAPVPLEDMTDTDDQVQPTGNGPQPDDPDEQPSQDPADLPDGTDTEQQ
jgi:hypothetical protein